MHRTCVVIFCLLIATVHLQNPTVDEANVNDLINGSINQTPDTQTEQNKFIGEPVSKCFTEVPNQDESSQAPTTSTIASDDAKFINLINGIILESIDQNYTMNHTKEVEQSEQSDDKTEETEQTSTIQPNEQQIPNVDETPSSTDAITIQPLATKWNDSPNNESLPNAKPETTPSPEPQSSSIGNNIEDIEKAWFDLINEDKGRKPESSSIVPPLYVANSEQTSEGLEKDKSKRNCPTGECVPRYMCVNGTIFTSGKGVFNERIGDDTENSCEDFTHTCCLMKLDADHLPKIEKKAGCGYRNLKGIGVRFEEEIDHEAQYGEFPWMVAVSFERADSSSEYLCGGSLIHPSVVLTAAHCVQGKKPKTLQIRAGEWDTQTSDEMFPHQDRSVAEVVKHEKYYRGGLFNDIALLFLVEPVEMAENINTACLPPQEFNFDGKRCAASGWGKDVYGVEGEREVILKKIEMPTVPNDVCEEQLRHTRLTRRFKLHESFMCAGGEKNQDTCKGDGGSPLVCPIPDKNEQYYQAGIVAWGIGCFEDRPGVYVNVAKFRNWIDDIFKSKEMDTSFYTL